MFRVVMKLFEKFLFLDYLPLKICLSRAFLQSFQNFYQKCLSIFLANNLKNSEKFLKLSTVWTCIRMKTLFWHMFFDELQSICQCNIMQLIKLSLIGKLCRYCDFYLINFKLKHRLKYYFNYNI